MLDFKLSDEFVDSYRDKPVNWGYKDGAGNALGELVFLRTYSRKDAFGNKETWVDTCRRVIEGMFSIQKRHCRTNAIEWKNDKAQRTAKDAFDRLFHLKWAPAGRGLWAMGTPLVMEDGNSAPLQSCAYVSTRIGVSKSMQFLFDASMLGVGVGFDASGANKTLVREPILAGVPYAIPDSREGWVESLGLLLDAYLGTGKRVHLPEFDYRLIRPAGEPIKRFGGVASGPAPLKDMHERIKAILDNRVGENITMTDIADIGNIIGTCVVAGNVRRCLPEGTRVHLTDGIRNIEDVRVGDMVETSGSRARVTNVFDQGVQDTVVVRYVGGEIECTPNHQVAVFESVDSWTFKRADELTDEDRIVWDREGISGRDTHFPPYVAPEKKAHDTVGQELKIPDLDAESAWFIGMVHGDGYVFIPSGKTPNGSVSVASAPDTPDIPGAVAQEMEKWGARAHIKPGRDGDAAIRISAYSSRMAEYFYDNVKKPNESIEIPLWIKDAYPEIRMGYLAGLFDADGSYKTHPLQAVVTVYRSFAKQVVEMYASIGIQARVKLTRAAQGKYQDLYSVDIVGGHNIRAFENTVALYSLKYEGTRPFRSAWGATFSADMVRLAGLKAPDVYGKAPQNAERIEKLLDTHLPAIPYQVLEVIPSGRSVQTYDIEVEGIHQFTAEGIVVHNSAEIFFVDRDSDDLEDFIALKDYEKNPQRASHGFMSNNTVRVNVGDDLTPLLPGIKLNGEPGLVWMDLARTHGRLKDPADNKDWRAEGTNPCFPADTLLATEDGWISFGDAFLSKEPQRILVDGRVSFEESEAGKEYPEDWKIDLKTKYQPEVMQASEVFLTQENAPIVKVTLSNGIDLRCTPDHLIATKAGMVRADELSPEHKVLITRGFLPEAGRPDLTERENMDAFVIGLIAGDGYIAKGKLTENVYIDLWGPDKEIAPVITRWIEHLFEQFKGKYLSNSNRPFTPYIQEMREDRDQIRIHSSFLAAYLNGEYGFNKATKHTVPSQFISKAKSSSARAYVAGLAFADGTINKLAKVGSSNIRIGQINKSLLQDVQRILLANGIASSIYLRRKSRTTKIHGTPTTSKDFFELIVMMNSFEYTKYVGFGLGYKQEQASRLFTKQSRKQATYSSVVSVEDDGIEDVYCLKEPIRRVLSANGVTARRCGEQILESGETCNLAEIFTGNHESRDDLIKTMKVAYLYGKTVTLLPTKWEATNTIMQRNRRIGLSLSGVADFVDNQGLPKLRDMAEDGYGYVERLDKKYSEWLCVRESIRRTTVKPSGSISILAGSSPGVHWTPGGEYFIRRITFAKTDPIFLQLVEAGYKYAPLDYDPNSAVVLFPVHSKSKRSSEEVPAWEKFHLAAEMQRWWSDNAVSCTVDFHKHEAEDIATLLSMYDGSLKGISLLPALEGGAYKNMPYERISKDEYDKMCETISKADFSIAYVNGEEAAGEKYCSTDVCETGIEIQETNSDVEDISHLI